MLIACSDLDTYVWLKGEFWSIIENSAFYRRLWMCMDNNQLDQECIIERERRVLHSVYALYAIPGNGSRPFVQALNRKRVHA